MTYEKSRSSEDIKTQKVSWFRRLFSQRDNSLVSQQKRETARMNKEDLKLKRKIEAKKVPLRKQNEKNTATRKENLSPEDKIILNNSEPEFKELLNKREGNFNIEQSMSGTFGIVYTGKDKKKIRVSDPEKISLLAKLDLIKLNSQLREVILRDGKGIKVVSKKKSKIKQAQESATIVNKTEPLKPLTNDSLKGFDTNDFANTFVVQTQSKQSPELSQSFSKETPLSSLNENEVSKILASLSSLNLTEAREKLKPQEATSQEFSPKSIESIIGGNVEEADLSSFLPK
ncbi:MAG: hypothetical protein LBT02_02140, partial [Rickettsiales bacterium]|nr:hypothetical protein [Rickettsiales bacterium]